MISQTPEQRVLYDARLKFQRDEEARLRKAREDGIQEGEARGRQEGVIVGRVLLLQQLLGLPQSTMDEFAGCDASQLAEMEEQLQRQLRVRGQ